MGWYIHQTWRITLVAALAAAVLWSSAGISIVQLAQAKSVASDKHEVWPCRYHNCGCINAEFCKNHCKCFKPQVVKVETESPRSCCAKQEKSQAEQSNEHSQARIYMTIQSPQCSGKNDSAYFKIITSQVEPMQEYWFILEQNENIATMSSLLHSQCNLLLDPPPPRWA